MSRDELQGFKCWLSHETFAGSLDALRGPLITQLPDVVPLGTTSGTLDLALAGHPLWGIPFKKA